MLGLERPKAGRDRETAPRDLKTIRKLGLLVLGAALASCASASKQRTTGLPKKAAGAATLPTVSATVELELALPAVAGACARPGPGGTWLALAGKKPARLQLGATRTRFSKKSFLPSATVWRQRVGADKRACWVPHELFPLPRGRTVVSLSLGKAASKKPARAELTYGGQRIAVSLAPGPDGDGVELSVAIAGKRVGRTIFKQAMIAQVSAAGSIRGGGGCFQESGRAVTARAIIDAKRLWFWLACESDGHDARELLRFDAEHRALTALYSQWRSSVPTSEGCGSCVHRIAQLMQRASSGLAFRDERVTSDGVTFCESDCESPCSAKKSERDKSACETRCDAEAKAEHKKQEAACNKGKEKSTRRWELLEADGRVGGMVWPKVKRWPK